ncbi:hypothetical protein BH10CYA1_BH10CYA1_30840 [soil metagenome]
MAPEKPTIDVPPVLPVEVHEPIVTSEGSDHADQYDATRAATWGPSATITYQPWMPQLAREGPVSGSLDMVSGTVTPERQTEGEIVRQDGTSSVPDTPEAAAKRAQDFLDALKKLGVDLSGVQEVDENGKPLKPRDAKDVKEIVLREGHKEGDPKPNFIIDKDGKIHEVVDPNKARGEGDGAMIVEIDPNTEGHAATQAQRTAAQSMIETIKANWRDSSVSPDIPDDLITAANAADPPPVFRSRPSGGGSGNVIGGAGGGGGGGGGGRGFSGGGMSGAGGPERHMSHAPQIGADGHLQSKIPQDSPLFKALDNSKLPDRIIAATAGLESGGKLDVINHNDAGHGWSVGIRQWNQQAGELPSLIQAMYDRDPSKFNQDFGQFAGQLIKNGKVDENFVRHTNFNGLGPGFEHGMKQALNDFQDVQVALARQWAQSGIDLAQKYGMKSELGFAEVADAVNQYGYGGAESRLRRLGTGGDEASRIQAFDHALGSQRGSRLAQLSSKFSADKTALA